ncbi:hypothetical protein ACWDU8_32100, partial [Streptomyces sp. NPDC003388]
MAPPAPTPRHRSDSLSCDDTRPADGLDPPAPPRPSSVRPADGLDPPVTSMRGPGTGRQADRGARSGLISTRRR